MPPKRVYRKRRPARVAKRKRVFRKKSRFNRMSMLKFNPRGSGVLVPDRFMTTMKCTATGTYTDTSGVTSFVIRGNGLENPFGSQYIANATGLAQMYALYERYVVHGARVRVDFCNGTSVPKHLVCFPYVGTAPTSLGGWLDQPYVKSALVSGNAGMDRKTLVNYMSTRKIIGVKDIKDLENQWGSSGSNPGFPWYFQVNSTTGLGTGTSPAVFKITMTYYVEWFDRKDLNQL